MPTRRQIAFIRPVALAVGGAIVIWFGAAAIVAAVFGRDVQAGAPWLAVGKFVSLAWVAAIGWLFAWPRLDEMQREARKASWFGGSTAAILLTAPVMLLWLVNGGAFLARHLGRATPGAYFAAGWGGLVIAQLLCSLIAAAAWRAAKH